MPRRARIVILRGIDRAAVFFEEDDRRFFLEVVGAAEEEESVAVHAYVLMTNHIHLLMTARRGPGVSAVMKRGAQRYVHHVNRTYHRRVGLFEGRFRSSLIEADGYLLACQRYSELNPVRAGMVSAPGAYLWSSYRANALGAIDPVVRPHALYRDLAGAEEARRAAYRRLFEDELDAALLQRLRDCTNGGFVLGSPKFERQVAAMVGRRVWKGSPGRPRKETDAGEQGELAF
jgi:putative transposase